MFKKFKFKTFLIIMIGLLGVVLISNSFSAASSGSYFVDLEKTGSSRIYLDDELDKPFTLGVYLVFDGSSSANKIGNFDISIKYDSDLFVYDDILGPELQNFYKTTSKEYGKLNDLRVTVSDDVIHLTLLNNIGQVDAITNTKFCFVNLNFSFVDSLFTTDALSTGYKVTNFAVSENSTVSVYPVDSNILEQAPLSGRNVATLSFYATNKENNLDKQNYSQFNKPANIITNIIIWSIVFGVIFLIAIAYSLILQRKTNAIKKNQFNEFDGQLADLKKAVLKAVINTPKPFKGEQTDEEYIDTLSRIKQKTMAKINLYANSRVTLISTDGATKKTLLFTENVTGTEKE